MSCDQIIIILIIIIIPVIIYIYVYILYPSCTASVMFHTRVTELFLWVIEVSSNPPDFHMNYSTADNKINRG